MILQLKTRLTVQFILVVAPIVFISFVIIYYSSSSYRKQEFYNRLKNKANTTAEFLIKVEQVDSSLLKIIDRTQKDHLPNENISIYNYLNREIYTNNDSIYFKVNKDLLDKIRLNETIEYQEGKYEIVGLTYNDRYNRFIVIAGAIDTFGLSKLRNLRNTLFILFILIIALVAVVGRIYASRALLPISALAKESENISPHNLSIRLKETKYDDEIGKLINNFNKLLERIEDAFKIQKLFFASASHELKNPLMLITAQLEVSIAKNRTNQEYKDTMASVLEDIKDLNKLTIQLMELARVSYDSRDIQFTRIRIDTILWSSIEFFTLKYPNYHCDFSILNLPEDESDLFILGNETLLKTMFLNLADNACKFSEDKSVTVTLDRDKAQARIVFNDNGPGIEVAEQKLVFEPFYRSRSKHEIKGHGIGLALVNQIMILHHAKIFFDCNKKKGTSLILIFNNNSNDILSKV